MLKIERQSRDFDAFPADTVTLSFSVEVLLWPCGYTWLLVSADTPNLLYAVLSVHKSVCYSKFQCVHV